MPRFIWDTEDHDSLGADGDNFAVIDLETRDENGAFVIVVDGLSEQEAIDEAARYNALEE